MIGEEGYNDISKRVINEIVNLFKEFSIDIIIEKWGYYEGYHLSHIFTKYLDKESYVNEGTIVGVEMMINHKEINKGKGEEEVKELAKSVEEIMESVFDISHCHSGYVCFRANLHLQVITFDIFEKP